MSMPVVLRPLANADVQQIHAELEAQALGLGDKFLDRLGGARTYRGHAQDVR